MCDYSTTSHPQSHLGRARRYPLRQRMESPASCATSCAIPAADESNHSATGIRHIHIAVPHICHTLRCAERSPPHWFDLLWICCRFLYNLTNLQPQIEPMELEGRRANVREILQRARLKSVGRRDWRQLVYRLREMLQCRQR